MEAYFLYVLVLSPTNQNKPAQKQQFEIKFYISENLPSLFIRMAVLSASFSNRIVKFQDLLFSNREAKRR